MIVVLELLLVWGTLLAARASVAHAMGLPRRWALATPLGAGVFAAMMLTSAWKVLSGRGVIVEGEEIRSVNCQDISSE